MDMPRPSNLPDSDTLYRCHNSSPNFLYNRELLEVGTKNANVAIATRTCSYIDCKQQPLSDTHTHVQIMAVIVSIIGRRLATEAFIGKLPDTRGVWVIIYRVGQ